MFYGALVNLLIAPTIINGVDLSIIDLQIPVLELYRVDTFKLQSSKNRTALWYIEIKFRKWHGA